VSGRGWIAAVLLAAAVVAAIALLVGPPAGDRPTVRSSRPAGLLGAYEYLERRGYAVGRWERPLNELPLRSRDTLVAAAPWTLMPSPERVRYLSRWISAGGRLVLFSSGRHPGPAEELLYSGLRLSVQDLGARAPLSWSGWREWTVEARRIVAASRRPAETPFPRAPLAAAQVTHIVRPTERADVLYEDREGTAMIFRERIGQGWLLVVNDASVLSNDRIGEAGNLAFLEALAAEAAAGGEEGPRLLFCEWLHGFREAGGPGRERAEALAWLGLHVLLLYLATLWMLGRRFGPPLREVGVPESSLRRDVGALAGLHHGAGHAPEAGRRLLELVRREGGSAQARDELPGRFEGGERELVDLARRIGRLQREGKL
jgi:hypothetical protein